MTDSASRPLRVFLCHSSGDKPVVRELYQKLNDEGWIHVWLDEERLLPGQDWDYEIEKALDNSDAVIVTLSTGSVSKEGYVQKELRAVLDIALEKPEGTIYVLPVRLDDCQRPRRLRSIHGVDYFPENLRPWAYQRVLESLKSRAKHLNLSTYAFESTPIPHQHAPSLGTPLTSQSVPPYQYVGPKPTVASPEQSVKIKRKPIWFYGRLAVILLLVLAISLFGAWRSYLAGMLLFFSAISDISAILTILIFWTLPALAIIALFLVTLARLFPWRFRLSLATVRLERVVAGIACILISGSIYIALATLLFLSEGRRSWLSSVGVDLAAINILLELRSTLQKGQKMPLWAWLLAVSIVLPWLAIISYLLYINYVNQI